MAHSDLLADLNPAQREAVEATSGPVCILAGAGTGKTRVITRRVGHAIATGVVHPGHVLVVTFTDKAASEMRDRLAGLGHPGVRAATFHAAALAQLRYFWPRHAQTPLPEVLDSKAPLLAPLARSLPGGYRYVALRDLAEEIEWAKVRRIAPDSYGDAVATLGRTPPLPPDLFAGLFARYERAKARAGRLDFEDMLACTVDLLADDAAIAEEVRGRYRWFSVDEYQDTNPLQQALLDAWLGGREDVAVVGDEDQTIYTFTGASSEYLTGFARRHARATVIRLEQNYRSSPQVLALANRILARAHLAPVGELPAREANAGGSAARPRRLAATRPDGPEPAVVAHVSAEAEQVALVAEVRRLLEAGTAAEEIAVLVRTNAQIPPLEEALGAQGIDYSVRGELFFGRGEVRRALSLLRRRRERSAGGGLSEAIESIWFEQLAFRREAEPEGEEARQRHASLVALLGMADQLASSQPDAGLDAFLADVARRAEAESAGAGAGVSLLTYHRAKGLEFDAVLLPALEEGMLPIRQATSPQEIAEERRLLYVGITRARTHLWLSWAARREGASGRLTSRKPSRFLDLLVVPGSRPRPRAVAAAIRSVPAGSMSPLAETLRTWRRERAARDEVPAYVVFNDRTLAQLAERRPSSPGELLAVEGIGPSKLERYGTELLALLSAQA